MAHNHLVLLILLACVARGLSFSCFGCPQFCTFQDGFPPPGHPGCPYGLVDEPCGCCKECGRGPGEECGSIVEVGNCGDGLRCADAPDPNEPGVCVEIGGIPPPPIGNWKREYNACIIGNNNLQLRRIFTLGDCKQQCELESGFRCRSVEYHSGWNRCVLSDALSTTVSPFLFKNPCTNREWQFAEMFDNPSPIPPIANEFRIGRQTFTVLEDHHGVTWSHAKSACIGQGYDLAEPENLVDLARHLRQNYGLTYYWLGGHGTGFNVKWLSGQVITRSSLWRTEYETSRDYCVYLRDDGSSNPIGSFLCSDTNYLYPLCEVKRPPPPAAPGFAPLGGGSAPSASAPGAPSAFPADATDDAMAAP